MCIQTKYVLTKQKRFPLVLNENPLSFSVLFMEAPCRNSNKIDLVIIFINFINYKLHVSVFCNMQLKFRIFPVVNINAI